jgi:NADH:ubiquinone oxidoreductase subunit E
LYLKRATDIEQEGSYSMEKNTIVICMGSSCFARGNDLNLRIIEKYLRTKGLEEKVFLKGTLCEGECTRGPVIIINGKPFFGVYPKDVEGLLERELASEKEKENA